MHDITRRKALGLISATGGLSIASSLALAAQDAKEPAGERNVVYGNRLRWQWRDGHWWVVVDCDSNFPHHWDPRRKCGDTAEHWVHENAFKSADQGGYCLMVPGKPGWWRITLVGSDVVSSKGYDRKARACFIEKKEEVDFGPADQSKPGSPRS
jgi:hypothetical protein